jgi:hypothetical protein
MELCREAVRCIRREEEDSRRAKSPKLRRFAGTEVTGVKSVVLCIELLREDKLSPATKLDGRECTIRIVSARWAGLMPDAMNSRAFLVERDTAWSNSLFCLLALRLDDASNSSSPSSAINFSNLARDVSVSPWVLRLCSSTEKTLSRIVSRRGRTLLGSDGTEDTVENDMVVMDLGRGVSEKCRGSGDVSSLAVVESMVNFET